MVIVTVDVFNFLIQHLFIIIVNLIIENTDILGSSTLEVFHLDIAVFWVCAQIISRCYIFFF